MVSGGIFCACSNEKKEVERVAFGYLDAFSNYRFDEACLYATQATCDTTLEFFKSLLPLMDSNAFARNLPAAVTLCGTVITSDSTASVAFRTTTPTKQSDIDSIYLFKENGQWLVDLIVQVPPIVKMLQSPQNTHGFTPSIGIK